LQNRGKPFGPSGLIRLRFDQVIGPLIKRSAFDLRHQRKAERAQRLSGALRFVKICVPGFLRNALGNRLPRNGVTRKVPADIPLIPVLRDWL
jgi:hypothetical protein